MNAFIMTDEQILELGFEALVDKLGPVGMIRFIHQFEAGTGNFTEDRRQWVGMSDVETLAKQIQQAEDNIEYISNTLSPMLEQKPDDTDVYESPTRIWADLQELERIEPDLAVGNTEKEDIPSFVIDSRVQEYTASLGS